MNDLPPLPEPSVRCGNYAGPPGEGASESLWDADQMQAYARAAVAAERERCAKLCERYESQYMAPDDLAAAIRREPT